MQWQHYIGTVAAATREEMFKFIFSQKFDIDSAVFNTHNLINSHKVRNTARIRIDTIKYPTCPKIPNEKVIKSQYTSQTKAKRSYLSLQVTTKQL